MPTHPISVLDLNFIGIAGTIASYLIVHPGGGVLVECGPGSTIPALIEGLSNYNLTPADISDVLLTHIHLDHAGAAGWLARQGARIHVHPIGAPHMLDPEKLLASAARIYGDLMEPLWGEFLPVPEGRLSVLQDGEAIVVNGLRFQPIDTPGHAEHHFVYLLGDICFSGDIGCVRLPGTHHIRLPMPPPEFHLEKWRQSLNRLEMLDFTLIAPTHFGIFSDKDWHLTALRKAMDETEAWIETHMPTNPPVEVINEKLTAWVRNRARRDGVPDAQIDGYETANPSWMSGYGIQRYWRKHRQ